MNRTRLTQMFIAVMALAATASTVYASQTSHTLHPSYGLALLALAAATSRMKIKLPFDACSPENSFESAFAEFA